VPGGTCSVPTSGTGSVQCTMPTLAAKASTSVTIVVRSDPSRISAVQNTVTVAASTPDPASANNTATVSSTLTTLADVRAVLSIPADNVPLGGSFPYTLTISNQGPSTAVNTRLSYTAPPGFTVTSLPTGPYCSLAGCTVPTLEPGASVVLSGTAQATTSTTPGRATVTVTATAATPDPNTADNTASTFVYVGAPELQVSVLGAITDTRRTRGADVGDRVVWTYAITNAGGSDATGVTVVLPGSTTPVPTTCQPGTLPKGATAACHIALPQTVTAADVHALAVTTTVQVTAAWIGGTEVRSPSASGKLVTVLPSSASIQGTSLSGVTTPGLQEAASRNDVAAVASPSGRTGQTAVAVGVLLSAAAGTALGLRPLRRRS
jgi:uncharacterized repeat protein (TIGR01451 family)